VLAVVLADAALERRGQAADELDRQRLALGLVDPQLLVLEPSDPAPDTEQDPAVREVVEQQHLLGDAHGMVPRQDDDHGPQLDPARPPGEVREDLERVRAQHVAAEVMLEAPERIEAERLGEVSESQLALHQLVVVDARMVHERNAHSDVHGRPRGWSVPPHHTHGGGPQSSQV
jgi:hypothetical protein